MTFRPRPFFRARVFIVLLAGCPALAGCSDFTQCVAADSASLARLPPRLSETGLAGPGVRPFRPAHELWTDGAKKQRWIRLPPGSVIDTSNPDDWSFPVGTRVWKEFERDGVRVETRMLERLGPAPDAWAAVAYVWNAAGDDAFATPAGAVDARGTPHDVPAADRCMGCHGGRASRVLGFSALQLAHDGPADEWTLERLAHEGALSAKVAVPPMPGNAEERAALGFLHANCGHCHNDARPPPGPARCFDPQNGLNFWLRLDRLATPQTTATYASAVGDVVTPGAPERSELFTRATSRGDGQMPPIGTEVVDPGAVTLLRAWIEGM